MCFSATASFLASGLLTMAGVATYWQVIDRRQMLLASIPLLFAIQQAAEGVVWLSFGYDAFAPWRIIAAYFFLFFAFIIWPIWAPLSVYYLESMTQFKDRFTPPIGGDPDFYPRGDTYLYDHVRKRLLPYRIMIAIGCLVSCYYVINLFRYDLIVQVLDCHILYKFPSNVLSRVSYLFVVLVPFLLARELIIRLFGVLLGVAFLVSYFFYYYLLVSVWCFFGALLSILTFIVIYKQRNNDYKQSTNR